MARIVVDFVFPSLEKRPLFAIERSSVEFLKSKLDRGFLVLLGKFRRSRCNLSTLNKKKIDYLAACSAPQANCVSSIPLTLLSTLTKPA